MIDQPRFEYAKNKVIGLSCTQRGIGTRQGIGTLQEKTVHAVLKHYYSPDESTHEIPLAGYVADIFTGERIIEIQTSGLGRMKEKLSAFLPLYPVTLIHPMPYRKKVYWTDTETGEVSGGRKSPVTGSPYRAFRELYGLKDYLLHPKLTLLIALIDMEEYRLLDGWSRDRKKGSHRCDRIPLSLEKEIVLASPEDYAALIPGGLEEPFTVKDFSAAIHLNAERSRTVVSLLRELGVVERMGKRGRGYLYRVSPLKGAQSKNEQA